MAKDIDTFADLIVALGGPKALGEICGRTGNQALNFGHKAKRAKGGSGSIAVEHWPDVILAARAKGLRIAEREMLYLATGRWIPRPEILTPEGAAELTSKHADLLRRREVIETGYDPGEEISLDVNWRGALLALAVLTGLGLIFALTIGG